MKIIENVYSWLKIFIFLLYILVVLGIWKGAPKYLHLINNLFSTVIAFALLYFFHPYTKTICNNLHRRIAFSAGLAILLQLSIFQYLSPIKTINKQF